MKALINHIILAIASLLFICKAHCEFREYLVLKASEELANFWHEPEDHHHKIEAPSKRDVHLL